jgi:hypothetical protein
MLRKLDPNTPEEELRANDLRIEYRKHYENLTKEELIAILVEQEVDMQLWDEANDKAQKEYEEKLKRAYDEERDNWKYIRDDD